MNSIKINKTSLMRNKMRTRNKRLSGGLCPECGKRESTKMDGQCDICYKALVQKMTGSGERSYKKSYM